MQLTTDHDEEQGAPSGSGFILDPDGTILTNAHIVAEASPQRRQGGGGSRGTQPAVHVALQDGRVFEGRVISADRWGLPPSSYADMQSIQSDACWPVFLGSPKIDDRATGPLAQPRLIVHASFTRPYWGWAYCSSM